MLPKHFLNDKTPLDGDDAVAALIVTPGQRYLLQQRDDSPGIFYPGHWGCFGGAVGPNEPPLQALGRELAEELEFTPDTCDEFVRFDFDLSRIGKQRKLWRIYYVVPATDAAVSTLVLHEGAAMRLFAPAEIFDCQNITPYDSFALWLHVARGRFR